MRKIFLIFSVIVTNIFYGQTKRGTLILGPAFNYLQSKNTQSAATPTMDATTSKRGDLTGMLKLGYFAADNFAIGVIAGYNQYTYSQKQKDIVLSQSSDYKFNIVSFGLFVRAYKMLNESRFGLFCQANAMYQLGKSESRATYVGNMIIEEYKNSSDMKGFTMGLSPGVVWFVTERIGLEASFGNLSYYNQTYNHFIRNQKDRESKSNDLRFSFAANTLLLGINFYLGGKKE